MPKQDGTPTKKEKEQAELREGILKAILFFYFWPILVPFSLIHAFCVSFKHRNDEPEEEQEPVTEEFFNPRYRTLQSVSYQVQARK